MDQVQILEREIPDFVSRGGEKLWHALERTKIEVSGMDALDLGLSTGGFTDCLLKRGAHRVWGVDVGQNQLNDGLRSDPRLKSFENTNARNLDLNFFGDQRFDLIVADVSFISLELVLPSAAIGLRSSGQALVLVKPQFETSPNRLAKGGIVRDPLVYSEVELKIRNLVSRLNWEVCEYFPSALEGGDGNKEFFIWAKNRNP